MTMPKVTEINRPLEAVTHDPFADGMPSARAWRTATAPRSAGTAVTHEPHLQTLRPVPATVMAAARL